MKLNIIISTLAALIFVFCSPVQIHAAPVLKDLPIGQRFAYQISWNGIPVGSVTADIEGLTVIQGRKAYKVSLRARTNRWASVIYEVDDTFITYIDAETSNSLRHEIARSEGRYRKKAVIEYLYNRFLAEYQYPKSGTQKSVDVAKDIHDPLSAACYFMRAKYKEGDIIKLNIDLNEKNYKLFAKIERGRPLNISSLGRVRTLIIRPYAERDGIPYKRGSGYAYVTDDERRTPLFAVVNVFIWGRFTASLH